MKTRVKMYLGMSPHTTSPKVIPLYKLQVKRWALLPRKTIAEGITKQEAIDLQKLIMDEQAPQQIIEKMKAERTRWGSVRKKFIMHKEYIIRKCVIEGMPNRIIANELGVSQTQLSRYIRDRQKEQSMTANPTQSKLLLG